MSALDDLSANPTTALPRSNGELVFAEPWESRAFGMAAALADQDVFNWADFQAGLIAAIAQHEGDARANGAYCYYEHWLTALETLAVKRGLISTREIDERVAEFQLRPDGHDHILNQHHHHGRDGRDHNHGGAPLHQGRP
jgi:nitrile hydratase accessory protein